MCVAPLSFHPQARGERERGVRNWVRGGMNECVRMPLLPVAVVVLFFPNNPPDPRTYTTCMGNTRYTAEK